MENHRYTSKDSAAARAGSVNVQALKYDGSRAVIHIDDWIGIDTSGKCRLAKGLKFLNFKYAFPINRGAGFVVTAGLWVLRHENCTIEIMDDATFTATFVPADGYIMGKFTLTVDAIRFQNNVSAVFAFVREHGGAEIADTPNGIRIGVPCFEVHVGWEQEIKPDDWLIFAPTGEYQILADDEFAKNFVPAEG